MGWFLPPPLWGGVGWWWAGSELGDQSLIHKMKLRVDCVGLDACGQGKSLTFKLKQMKCFTLPPCGLWW